MVACAVHDLGLNIYNNRRLKHVREAVKNFTDDKGFRNIFDAADLSFEIWQTLLEPQIRDAQDNIDKYLEGKE